MSWHTKVAHFFEWVPLGSAATIVAIISLFSREIDYTYQGYDIPFIIALVLVIGIVGLLTGKKFISNITVLAYDEHNNERKLDDLNSLDASDGEVDVDLVFEVPNHHESVCLFFGIEEYTVGIEQYHPVNFDNDKAVTYHSKIPRFELTLRLIPESNEYNQGSEIPLVIKDKIHNKTICEIHVKGGWIP